MTRPPPMRARPAPPPIDFDDARPTRPGRRSGLIGAALLIALAIGGYYALWAYVRDQTLEIVTRQIEAQREAGYDITWSMMHVGGFPGRVSVVFEDGAIAAPTDYGGWRWTGEGLRLSLWPFDVRTLYFDAIGAQRVSEPGGEPTSIAGSVLVARVSYDDRGAITSVGLTARDAIAQSHGVRVAILPSLRARATRDENEDIYRITAIAERPRFAGVAEGDTPSRAAAQGALSGADAFVLYRGVDPRALAAWSRADGRLNLSDACLVWQAEDEEPPIALATADQEGCLDVDGPAVFMAGDVGLDRNGRWNGELRLSARQPRAAFERLGALGVLAPEAAAQAGSVAEAMAGANGEITAPVTIRNGGVYFFLVRLTTLPRAY